MNTFRTSSSTQPNLSLLSSRTHSNTLQYSISEARCAIPNSIRKTVFMHASRSSRSHPTTGVSCFYLPPGTKSAFVSEEAIHKTAARQYQQTQQPAASAAAAANSRVAAVSAAKDNPSSQVSSNGTDFVEAYKTIAEQRENS
jgi:hypothetical protein